MSEGSNPAGEFPDRSLSSPYRQRVPSEVPRSSETGILKSPDLFLEFVKKLTKTHALFLKYVEKLTKNALLVS